MCVYIRCIPAFLSELLRVHQVYVVSVLLLIVQGAVLPQRDRQLDAAFLASAVSVLMRSITTDVLLGCVIPAKKTRFAPVDLQARAWHGSEAVTTL